MMTNRPRGADQGCLIGFVSMIAYVLARGDDDSPGKSGPA
jgi:hypothetical protein